MALEHPRLGVPTSEQLDEAFTAAKQGKLQTKAQLKATAGSTRGQGAAKTGLRGHILTFLVFGMVATQVCFSVPKC